LLRYAIITNDVIENVIVADLDFIDAHYPDAIECPEGFGVGDGYKDGEFFRIQVIAEADELETI
jgi:hypothetical protein